MDALLIFAGLILGAGAAWLYFRSDRAVMTERLGSRDAELTQLRPQLEEARTRASAQEMRAAELAKELELERKATVEKLAAIEQARKQLEDTFRAAAAAALHDNSQTFREQAVEQLVKPIGESLEKVDRQIRELEAARAGAYSGLTEQVRSLSEAQGRLQSETANLVKALRQPQTRGRWGELQLQRVVELAGMQEHVNFEQQVVAETGRQRPDMTVLLPGGTCVVVDAKAPLEAYLAALEAPDEATRAARLKDHARQVRAHVDVLSDRGYWQSFEATPEFVVLFLPGEPFFSAALQEEPELLEYALDRSVLLASPTTLIALLKSVAYGWTQQKLADSAQQICDLGRELYDRLATFGDHFEDLRKGLERAVSAYNAAVGSLEGRVLVSARKFRELGAGSQQEIAALEPVEHTPRAPQSPELTRA